VLFAAAVTGTVLGASLGGGSALLPGALAAARPTVTATVTVGPAQTSLPPQAAPTATSTAGITTTATTTASGVAVTRRDCPTPSAKAISKAPGTGRTIALTFDDGPGEDTEALLVVLREHDVHATFFMVGKEAAAHPDLVAAVSAGGHLIGDHSWDHRYPKQVTGGWTASSLASGMTRTNGAVTGGGGPVCWFRPPGGFMPATLLPAARAQGMSVVLWSVDPLDWKLQEPGSKLTRTQQTAEILKRVTAGIGTPHPIVLMHDGGGDRRAGVAAVGDIIEHYQAAGYRFVRLDGEQ
jgi:peptidoglycan/xylan/chitin deacetylase (PgdA/CDA1 family)